MDDRAQADISVRDDLRPTVPGVAVADVTPALAPMAPCGAYLSPRSAAGFVKRKHGGRDLTGWLVLNFHTCSRIR
ncbi:MAG TPA: hypothetical protein VNH82_03175 [Candidatus Dormibacteraeota bacterium]|nr:hypothetical protein [Candidatus Dormibacteraeota bacterium]